MVRPLLPLRTSPFSPHISPIFFLLETVRTDLSIDPLPPTIMVSPSTFLALLFERPEASGSSSKPSGGGSSTISTGGIVGAVIGGLIAVAAVQIALVWCLCRASIP